MGWAPNNPVKNMFPVTRLPLIRSFLFPPTKPTTGRDKAFNTKNHGGHLDPLNSTRRLVMKVYSDFFCHCRGMCKTQTYERT